MDLSFDENANSCKVLSFAQSIAAHFFGGKYTSNSKMNEEMVNKYMKNLYNQDDKTDLEAVYYLTRVQDKSKEIIEAVVGLMSFSIGQEFQLYVARFLATVPPQQLLQFLLTKGAQREEDDQRVLNIKWEKEHKEFDEATHKMSEWNTFERIALQKYLDVPRSKKGSDAISIISKCYENPKEIPLLVGLCSAKEGEITQKFINLFLECLFEDEYKAFWRRIIQALRELEKHSEIPLEPVIEKLKEKKQSCPQSLKAEITLTLMILRVNEEWLSTEIFSDLCESINQAVNDEENMKNNLALFTALSHLKQWDERIEEKFAVLLGQCALETEGLGIQTLMEGIRAIRIVGIENNEIDQILVKLLQHDNEKVRNAAGQALGNRQKKD
eukprot:TRINITY_DN2347_c0_g1_i4.p1 TRINITY_DN2347_c0_g1~~TRINITY_DN2347_c0_g1_i4.p1  ORF type:complete len:437 (-),score=83.94 TRINITY_DN2347_c0_g1_i4:19-1170(-)